MPSLRFIRSVLSVCSIILSVVILWQLRVNPVCVPWDVGICLRRDWGILVLALFSILSVIMFGWLGIVDYIRTREVKSIAEIERLHPYIPTSMEITLTIVLSAMYLPLMVNAETVLVDRVGGVIHLSDGSAEDTMDKPAAPVETGAVLPVMEQAKPARRPAPRLTCTELRAAVGGNKQWYCTKE